MNVPRLVVVLSALMRLGYTPRVVAAQGKTAAPDVAKTMHAGNSEQSYGTFVTFKPK